MDCHVQKPHSNMVLEQLLTVFFLHNLESRKCCRAPEALSQRGENKKTQSVLKQRHMGIDKREEQSRLAQPKLSNTQLDESLRCKQLWGTGVDQDPAVACKGRKYPFREGLFAHRMQVRGTPHLARYYLLIPPSLACLHHGFYWRTCTTPQCLIVKSFTCSCPTACSEPGLKWMVNYL